MTHNPRPPIYPSGWLEAPLRPILKSYEDVFQYALSKKAGGRKRPTYIDRGVEHGLDTPMPTAELERLKSQAAAEYAPPFTITEIKAVLESDRKLPCWDDLIGCAPGATGALSSEEFVRVLRDDWV